MIADIDPHNMLEGKPRPQTMPAPLQLVAYLPLVESAEWEITRKNLLRTLSVIDRNPSAGAKDVPKGRIVDEKKFWTSVRDAQKNLDEASLEKLWSNFSDPEALLSRSKACQDNGHMQPTGRRSGNVMFSTPAFYDWIDVSLTLSDQEELPLINAPAWKRG